MMYRTFDDMCWPAPCEEMGDLVHRLTWGVQPTTKNDRILSASIISAYMQIISDSTKQRQRVVRELRAGPNLPKPCIRDAKCA